MLKERMTPEEIAHLTGYSRQTINKWVRKEGWQNLSAAWRPGWQSAAGPASMSKSGVYPQRSARGRDAPGAYSTHDSDLESLLLTLSKRAHSQRARSS